MLGAPKVKAIRGFSDFGFSYVYVIFEDGTDIYWARSRVLEYLSKIRRAAAAGREDGARTGRHRASAGSTSTRSSTRPGSTTSPSCARSRTGTCATGSRACPASRRSRRVGGFQKQYQVDVDPERARRPTTSARRGRRGDPQRQQRRRRTAGRVQRARVHGPRPRLRQEHQGHRADRRWSRSEAARPILVKNVGTVALGPEIRRGIADLDGEGDTVGGIVVMRAGENALNVIERVKAKLKEIEAVAAQGRRDRHDLRPLGPDRPVHRHAQGEADRGDRSSSAS